MNVPKLPIPSGAPPSPLVDNPEAASSLLQNTMVIYGPTGSRKTSQIGAFAKYIYEKTGKKTRLLSMDNGGWGTIQDIIDTGIIEPWNLINEDSPRTAIIKASKGAWPDRMEKGRRMSQHITEHMPDKRAVALRDVGAYAVEGWASIASAVMGSDVRKGVKISEDVVGLWKEGMNPGDTTNLESFGAPARSHYGSAHTYTKEYIRNFAGLPLERVLYTSLEGKGTDKMDGVTHFGPLVIGGAITASIPAFVGDCLHFEDFRVEAGTDPNNPKQKLIDEGVRVWFTKHPDAQSGTLWPAKSRVMPSQTKEFRARMGAPGYFILGDNAEPDLGTYLRLQDEMLGSATEKALAWKRAIDEKRKGD